MSSPLLHNYSTLDPDRSVEYPPSAGFVSRIFLSWVRPLMDQAHKYQLNSSDVWSLPFSIRADTIAQRFQKPLLHLNGSIPRALIQVFGIRFIVTGLTMLVSMMCSLVGPLALHQVVSALSDDQDQSKVMTASRWVRLEFAAQVVQALADCYTGLQNEVIAIQCITLLKTMLYQKMLKLTIVNRSYVQPVIHQMWLIPLQIVVVSYMLVRVLDIAALAGIAVIVLMLWLNHLISKRMHSVRRECIRKKDKRMKKVTEAFKAMSIIKFNVWEDPITARINAARETELRSILKMRVMTSLSIVLLWGMPVFISIAAFGTFTGLLHRDLTPAIMFTSLALFVQVQAPLRATTLIVSMAIQSSVAFERISAFLRMPELDVNSVISIDDLSAEEYLDKDVIVAVEHGELAWDVDGVSLLMNVNIEVKVGEFLVVHGMVGCGKSSLCSALLGAMEKRKGTVFMGGSVAYCSQQPWIQNKTIRDNILFGHSFNRKKYRNVLDACALTSDLEFFPAGDLTEIGGVVSICREVNKLVLLWHVVATVTRASTYWTRHFQQ